MSSGNGSDGSFPLPRRKRWQPLRGGLLNLYRFDYEEFHFEDGRLLLRGNNGSGKSRVLALQLPFLLDGDVRPGRVEPDADPAKRIEWNLLMGRHSDRTGYTWIEFGRREADGTEHYLTLGCGMRAVAGESGLHSRWYFLTSQRVGRDLFLQTPQRTPLGRAQLEAAIGASGRLPSKADDYRRAVDEALFGLGPRFGPLIELLLQLRRPQLSRKLDEDDLSRALSEALPTLSAPIIDDVAESFASLQNDRGTLRDFAAAQQAVDSFLADYAGYIRIAVRRRAQAVREAHSRYEAAQRALRDAERRAEEAAARLTELASQRGGAATALAGAEAAERTLRDSPEMRTAGELGAAAEAAQTAAAARAQAETDDKRAEEAAERASDDAERLRAEIQEFSRQVETVLVQASERAAAAGMARLHEQWMAPSLSADAGSVAKPGARPAIERESARLRRSLERLLRCEDDVATARAAVRSAEQAAQQAAAAASEAREAERQHFEDLERNAAQLSSQYDRWLESLRQLAPRATPDWNEALAAWQQGPTGPGPIAAAVTEALRTSEAGFLKREMYLRRTLEEGQRRKAEIAELIAQLERGVTLPPPAPRLARADRQQRAGAPLWRVVDFRPEVPDEARAHWEAALESSGLLDAWLMPDGSLLAEADDRYLLARARAETPLRHLGEILVPAIDPEDAAGAALTPAIVEAALRQVGGGPGESDHWAASDGRWRLGPLAGRATKPAAEFLGAGARAGARRRQLEVLREEQAKVESELGAVAESEQALRRDRTESADEAARAPSENPVIQAGFRLAEAGRRLAVQLHDSREAEAEAVRAREKCQASVRIRDQDAADLGLSSWIGRGAELERALAAYELVLARLWPELRHLESVFAQLSQARVRADGAQEERKRRLALFERAQADAEASRRRYETMKALHGATVETVMRQLAQAESAVRGLKERLGAILDEERNMEGRRSGAQAEADGAVVRRAECDEQRRIAISSLRRLAEERLLAEAHSALREIEPGDWSPAYAIDLVRRRIDEHLADIADDVTAWARGQNTIQARFQELRDHLVSRGYMPELHQSEDVVVARCVFLGRSLGMTELRDAFAAEISQREELLRAKERETIENHLLAEAAVELVKLIRSADQWRGLANDELGQRPTSAGVKFRFQWEPGPEGGFAAVRPLLLRRGELWSPAERTQLAQFLQGRIAAEQAEEAGGSWRDHLARALDYRRWHRFIVERYQDGQWKRLNRANYGTGSGGEKALALTLPRFAAAAAHYRSAAPTAPRLVMLDEAFAGIDPTMRGQCMGILAQFDLDVVMTSELEWGCYPSVPGLAIYNLTTLPGLDAVGVTRFTWNGHERRQEDTPLPPDVPPNGVLREATAAEEGLFSGRSPSGPTE